MFYDAQIAGLPTLSAVRMVKVLAARELSIVAALRSPRFEFANLPLINGAGPAGTHIVSQDHQLTELAAGSGLYGPALFDHYRDFTPMPAALCQPRGTQAEPTARGGVLRRLSLQGHRLGSPTSPVDATAPSCSGQKVPARCRPRCAVPRPRSCRSVIRFGFDTPRLVSCANGSTVFISSRRPNHRRGADLSRRGAELGEPAYG